MLRNILIIVYILVFLLLPKGNHTPADKVVGKMNASYAIYSSMILHSVAVASLHTPINLLHFVASSGIRSTLLEYHGSRMGDIHPTVPERRRGLLPHPMTARDRPRYSPNTSHPPLLLPLIRCPPHRQSPCACCLRLRAVASLRS